MGYNVTVSGTDYEGIDKVELPITDSAEKATFYANLGTMEDLITGNITVFESELLKTGSSTPDVYHFARSYAFSGCTKLERVSLPNVSS